MENLFDEFSKSLAESAPRRESLRRLGAVFASALLAPLGVATARAGRPDPCKAFCKCRTTAQQANCLDVCKACNSDTKRIVGSCGNYTCCSIASCSGVCSDLKHDPNCGACGNNCSAIGETCCGDFCADLANDVFNCGGCGTACGAPGPGEVVACLSGTCVYDCTEGADDCNGTCTFLGSDPDNCGACGNVCGESMPYCSRGQCWDAPCGGANLDGDPSNCGACGNICSGATPYCFQGTCTDCGGSWRAVCNGVCVNILSDASNCGACGNVCYGDYYVCSSGACVDPVCQFYDC
jgi:hypothetical protein